MEGERRTNLSEHSASEDSLDGAGYSNTFWSDQVKWITVATRRPQMAPRWPARTPLIEFLIG